MELTYLGIFSAGLLTFVTPCVLPLIPIYLSVLLGAVLTQVEEVNRTALLVRSLFFSLGFVLVFTLLGMGASVLGRFLILYQQTLQVAGGLLIFVFALKFLGYLQVPFLERTLRMDDQKLSRHLGPVGAFGMGLVFALGWSPCVGPILGAVLTYTASTTSDPITGAGYLGMYGLGFALPLLTVALFAQAGVRFIKKINRHLPTLERVTGVLLLVVSLSMIFGNVEDQPTVDPGFKLSEGPQEIQEGGVIPVPQMATLVEFYRDDCTVCKKMAPLMATIEQDCLSHQVAIRKINLSEGKNRHYIKSLRLRGVPTFIGYDESGSLQKRMVGEQSMEDLRHIMETLTGEVCYAHAGSLDSLEPFDSAQEASCDGETGESGKAACDL